MLALREENVKLRAQNIELKQQLGKVTNELQESNNFNKTIIAINEEFGRENDELYEKLDQYKNLRVPRSIQKSQVHKKRKHSSSDEDYEMSLKKISLNESGTTSSDDVYGANAAEPDEKKARVCIIFINYFMSIFIEILLFMDNLD